MNLKSLVFRYGTTYMTCWMLEGLVRFNDIVEFFHLGPQAELEKNLERVADEHTKLLLRYTLSLRGGAANIVFHNDYFCAPRDVHLVVREMAKLAPSKERTNAVNDLNDYMVEQLIQMCDADAVARTASSVYKLSETVHRDKRLQKRLKRQHPSVAAALDLLAGENDNATTEDEEVMPPPLSLVAPQKKNSRPYDLKKNTPPQRARPEEKVAEECETPEEC